MGSLETMEQIAFKKVMNQKEVTSQYVFFTHWYLSTFRGKLFDSIYLYA